MLSTMGVRSQQLELYGRTPADPMPADPDWAGATIFKDTQTLHTQATRAALYEQVCALGGERGWLVGNWLWAVRGWMDRTVGGVGMRRGRRHPTELRVGDVVDFWRVEAPNLSVCCDCVPRYSSPLTRGSSGRSPLSPNMRERSSFSGPCSGRAGLFGRAYWYAVAPFHRFIFRPLVRRIERQALLAPPVVESSDR